MIRDSGGAGAVPEHWLSRPDVKFPALWVHVAEVEGSTLTFDGAVLVSGVPAEGEDHPSRILEEGRVQLHFPRSDQNGFKASFRKWWWDTYVETG